MGQHSQYGRLDAGELLAGRFRLERYVGRGAMGHVWAAADTHLDDEMVACKALDASLIEDRQAINELKQEVLVSRRLHHPHVVAVYTFWMDSRNPFITMEWVDGWNLAQALEDRGAPFPLAEVARWVPACCDALEYAHSRHVLHRDVKPANILMRKDGALLLADFGVARTLRETQDRACGHDVSGTVMYMSPEQLLGKPLDVRSDLYSLAVTVYELLSGAPPFHDGAIAAQVQMRPPEPIPGLPASVNWVLLRALAKHPEDRYPDCSAFRQAFAEAVGGMCSEAMMVPSTPDGCVPTGAGHGVASTVSAPSTAGAGRRLGELLVLAAVITKEQLEAALAAQEETHERLGEVLTWMGYADEQAIARALAEQLQVPFLDLETERIDMAAARLLTFEESCRYGCLPVGWVGERLVLAMTDPLDFDAINLVEARIAGRADLCVVAPSGLANAATRLWADSPNPCEPEVT